MFAPKKKVSSIPVTEKTPLYNEMLACAVAYNKPNPVFTKFVGPSDKTDKI
jgi:hypothetical protein